MTRPSSIADMTSPSHNVPPVSSDLPHLDAVMCLTCCTHDHVLLAREEKARRVVLVVGLLSTHKILVRAYDEMNPTVWLQAHADLLSDAGGVPTTVQTDVFEFGFERVGGRPQLRPGYATFAEQRGINVQPPSISPKKVNTVLDEMRGALQAHLATALDSRPRASLDDLNESLQQLCAVFNVELMQRRTRQLSQRISARLSQ